MSDEKTSKACAIGGCKEPVAWEVYCSWSMGLMWPPESPRTIGQTTTDYCARHAKLAKLNLPESAPLTDVTQTETKVTGTVPWSGAEDHEKLYSACYRALEWADSGIHPRGSNYWMVMFVDRLQEQLPFLCLSSEPTPAVASKPLFVGPCSCSGVPHWHPNPGVTQADVDACVIPKVGKDD